MWFSFEILRVHQICGSLCCFSVFLSYVCQYPTGNAQQPELCALRNQICNFDGAKYIVCCCFDDRCTGGFWAGCVMHPHGKAWHQSHWKVSMDSLEQQMWLVLGAQQCGLQLCQKTPLVHYMFLMPQETQHGAVALGQWIIQWRWQLMFGIYRIYQNYLHCRSMRAEPNTAVDL